MTSRQFDIAMIGDFRYLGGTSTSISEEIKASSRAGYRVALLATEAPNLNLPFPVNPKIKSLLDDGTCTLIAPGDSVEATLVQVHNPYVATRLPQHSFGVQAEHRMLVVHHPPFDGEGKPYYDVSKVTSFAEEILNGEFAWAPVGPAVRAQLESLNPAPRLTEIDWYNILDVSLWHMDRDAPGDIPTIGRHSRPDFRKWPATREEILRIYADDPLMRVKILGGGDFLEKLVGPYPSNWTVRQFGAEEVLPFLESLDAYVYYHHPIWVEAFGYAILEALATGLPCILPPHFEPLFGYGAVYADPWEALETSLHLCADSERYKKLSSSAKALAQEKFSHEAHNSRLRSLIGPPKRRKSRKVSSAGNRKTTPTRVLMVSTNGVGMGHLTRLLAVSRKLPEGYQPIFVTMSQALSVVQDYGYIAEYIPSHQYLQCENYKWNKYLGKELAELIDFYNARLLVFDGNSPFQGVIDAAQARAQTWFVWLRRAMWQPGVGKTFIEREKYFDVVLEPRDLAEKFDQGLTTVNRARVQFVDPIRLLDESDIPSKEEARNQLGIQENSTALLLHLGSGNNYSYDEILGLTTRHAGKRKDVQVFVAQWMMSDAEISVPENVRVIKDFPLAKFFNAFDATVSAVGYNSFHDLIQMKVPTIFIPNENPQQDDQLARAMFAQRRGAGLCVRATDPYSLLPALDRLLDPGERATMSAACKSLSTPNGANQAGAIIDEFCNIRRWQR